MLPMWMMFKDFLDFFAWACFVKLQLDCGEGKRAPVHATRVSVRMSRGRAVTAERAQCAQPLHARRRGHEHAPIRCRPCKVCPAHRMALDVPTARSSQLACHAAGMLHRAHLVLAGLHGELLDGVLVLMVLPQLGGLQLSCDQLELHGGAQRYRALPHAARPRSKRSHTSRRQRAPAARTPLRVYVPCASVTQWVHTHCPPARITPNTLLRGAHHCGRSIFGASPAKFTTRSAHGMVHGTKIGVPWVKRIASVESCPSCWFWQSEVAIQNQVDRS